MSFRYTLEIYNKEQVNRPINSYQLFGNNEYISVLHDFVEEIGGTIDVDGYFDTVLDSKQLQELYQVVDEYCLALLEDEDHRVIDLLNIYESYRGRISLGGSLYNLLSGNYLAMQSAQFLAWAIESKCFKHFIPEYLELKDEYICKFKYSYIKVKWKS